MLPPQTLLDEASAQLPLFDDLTDAAVDRLAAGGFGRGLLSAALRARLRKAGFSDMEALARATPANLKAVRKIGPVRVVAIRAHILNELARLLPDARATHDQSATDQRRLDRLRAVPAGALLLVPLLVERSGSADPTWADLAAMRRVEAARALGLSAADLDAIVSALVRALLPERQRIQSAPIHDQDAASDVRNQEAHTELLRARDREWDEAAPKRSAPSAGAS
ncbi:hypothetical protein H0176_28740 [Methylorubrum populi]|jgi:hypothetical protein|nr:hypothetical protein [Methylorubrum rhodesianum]MBY0144197.1 hypothetical protein [Methylorubrum populi]